MKNKAIIISILSILLVTVGAYFLVRGNQSNEISDNQESSQVASPKTESNTSNKPTVVGTYVDYSEDALASAYGTKVLFFHASWCPQCRQLDADIKNGGIPDNTTILKVDYDSNQDLRKKYGVTIQTTFVVVDENGNLTKKYVAYKKPTLNNVISNLGL